MIKSVQTMCRSALELEPACSARYKEVTRELFHIWSSNIAASVKQVTKFAKCDSRFLMMDSLDQAALVKGARTEVIALVRCKNFRHQYNTYLDCWDKSGTLCVIPPRTLSDLFVNGSQFFKLFERYVILCIYY